MGSAASSASSRSTTSTRTCTKRSLASPTGEAILEEYVEGIELNGIVLARAGEGILLTLSDRMRPPGVGFGVGWIHVYPPTVDSDQLAESERIAVHTVHALGLETGIAFPQLIAADDGRVIVVECAARIPGGQMADLVGSRRASTSSRCSCGWRSATSCPTTLVRPRFSQPLAIRFLTAEPGPLPTGRVTRIGPLDKVLAFPGVVQADVYLQVGETIRPVRLDGDRRGYVIATASTNLEALERAEAAATPARRGGRVSDPRTKLVGAGYDAMIDTWETWSAQVKGDPRAEWLDKLIALLPDGGSVLELGCGGGTAESRAIAARFRLTGVDLSTEQLAAGAVADPERGVPPRRPRHHRVR